MLVCLLALGRQASAQDAPAAKETGKASLEGNVVREPTGEPLKKAIVELIAENQEEGAITRLPQIRKGVSGSRTFNRAATSFSGNGQATSKSTSTDDARKEFPFR
jgi:hypothetical protein